MELGAWGGDKRRTRIVCVEKGKVRAMPGREWWPRGARCQLAAAGLSVATKVWFGHLGPSRPWLAL